MNRDDVARERAVKVLKALPPHQVMKIKKNKFKKSSQYLSGTAAALLKAVEEAFGPIYSRDMARIIILYLFSDSHASIRKFLHEADWISQAIMIVGVGMRDKNISISVLMIMHFPSSFKPFSSTNASAPVIRPVCMYVR